MEVGHVLMNRELNAQVENQLRRLEPALIFFSFTAGMHSPVRLPILVTWCSLMLYSAKVLKDHARAPFRIIGISIVSCFAGMAVDRLMRSSDPLSCNNAP